MPSDRPPPSYPPSPVGDSSMAISIGVSLGAMAVICIILCVCYQRHAREARQIQASHHVTPILPPTPPPGYPAPYPHPQHQTLSSRPPIVHYSSNTNVNASPQNQMFGTAPPALLHGQGRSREALVEAAQPPSYSVIYGPK